MGGRRVTESLSSEAGRRRERGGRPSTHLGDADAVVVVLKPVETHAGHGGVGQPGPTGGQSTAAHVVFSLGGGGQRSQLKLDIPTHPAPCRGGSVNGDGRRSALY